MELVVVDVVAVDIVFVVLDLYSHQIVLVAAVDVGVQQLYESNNHDDHILNHIVRSRFADSVGGVTLAIWLRLREMSPTRTRSNTTLDR